MASMNEPNRPAEPAPRRFILLVPVDFSACSRYALEHAIRWASRATAELHILHVMEGGAETARGAAGEVAHRKHELEQMVAGQLAILDQSAPPTVAVSYHVSIGHPANVIVGLAERIDASAIVMGSHGRSGLRLLVVGSIAARVIRTAPCPVICTKLNAPLADPGAPIICPVDFSETSRRAFDSAVAIATRCGAPLQLLHVYQAPATSGPDSFVTFPTVLDELRLAANAALERLAAEARAAGVLVAARTQLGSPALEIVRAARGLRAGMVVMGTHGRTGLGHVFLGSVAEKVVRSAPCAVLTVRLAAATHVPALEAAL
jgi:nucleotide-binding universal stress UspA family protein